MKKLIFGILVAFGLVSVSFGAWIPEDVEKNYQKLKAEIEEYVGEECKWSEDGKKLISGRLCEFQKILLFFDEIRAMEVTKKQASRQGICFGGTKWKTCDKYDKFRVARREVREMPLFKNDSFIYSWTRDNNFNRFWEEVWDRWETKKRQLGIDGARRGYWKKLAE